MLLIHGRCVVVQVLCAITAARKYPSLEENVVDIADCRLTVMVLLSGRRTQPHTGCVV